MGKERKRAESSSKKAWLMLNHVFQQGKPARWFDKLGRGPGKFRPQRNVQRFRGGLVFKAHRLVYHSTIGLIVIKKKKKKNKKKKKKKKKTSLSAPRPSWSVGVVP